ncbi:hypothetical protein BJ165DRAFT_1595774 [Panaeolus papilionaceus]|nr:hypothetical protein BJ165DRAFT_1595774 [Panaeolus papilionaceus]
MPPGHYSDYTQTQDADMLEMSTAPATIQSPTPPKTSKRLIKRLAKLKGAKDLFPVNGEQWCNKPKRPKASRKNKKERPAVMKGGLAKPGLRKPRKRVSPSHSPPISPPQPPNTPSQPVGHAHELGNGLGYSFPVERSPTSSSGPHPIDEDWLQTIRLASLVSSAPWENIGIYHPPPSPPSEMPGVMDSNCNVESGPPLVPSNDPNWGHSRGAVPIPTFIQGPDSAPPTMQYTSYHRGNEILPSYEQSYSYPSHPAFANGWPSAGATPRQAEYRNDQPREMHYGQEAYNIPPNLELLECPTSDLQGNSGDFEWHVAPQNNLSAAGSHYSSLSG